MKIVQDEWSLKPKGWHFYSNLVIGILCSGGCIAFMIASFFFLPHRWPAAVFAILFCGIWLFLEIREIFVYRIRITPTEVLLLKGQWFIWFKWLRLKLEDLKSMYVSARFDRSGLYERLHFCYEDGSQQVIEVLRFSDYQLCDIIDKIKENAEALNGKQVRLEEDRMQKGFRRKTRGNSKS